MVLMKVQVIWDMMMCSLVNGYERFEGVFFLQPQGPHSPRRMYYSDPGISSSK